MRMYRHHKIYKKKNLQVSNGKVKIKVPHTKHIIIIIFSNPAQYLTNYTHTHTHKNTHTHKHPVLYYEY